MWRGGHSLCVMMSMSTYVVDGGGGRRSKANSILPVVHNSAELFVANMCLPNFVST